MKEAREWILDILYQVFFENGYASLLMRKMKADEKDTAFIAETVYGTIRNYALLEYQWRPYAKKVRNKTALILDMAVYQIFFMDVPDYACVNEAVELAKGSDKNFVNAVLRKVIAAGMKQPASPAEQYSHPAWLAGLWKAHYGEEIMLEILKHDQKKPVLWGRINTLKTTKEEIESTLGVTFADDICFSYEGALQKSEAFRSGKVLIQNISSMQPVRMLDPEPGMNVLDVCAAPGTKTQQIAMMMNNEGQITACDLHEHRCALIDQLMERTGVSIVHTRCMDSAEKGQFEEETFDRILCDAPCSGLGDLSHKPEIRWHLRPEDIDEIVRVQKNILDAIAPYLKRGGILVYSTCTLNKKENEKQAAAFLERHPEYELIEEKTFFPHETMGDGFYAAKLRRK